MPRRERWSIIGAILAEVEEESRRGDQARITNVAVRANLPHDRLAAYLGELAAAGMVTPDRFPRLTPRGREFLREYRQWTEVLGRFGLTRAEPPEPPRGGAGTAAEPPP